VSFIAETISERKQKVVEIIEERRCLTRNVHSQVVWERWQLNLARDQSGQYAQEEENNVKQMVVAGSKGSFINIPDVRLCQSAVGGRTTNFVRVQSRKNSSMLAGLIDMVVKTAETGYTQQQLVNALEDVETIP
jgi:DNA-directed RNA polymerase II subunit RPB1